MRLFTLLVAISALFAISSCTVSKQVKQLKYDAQKAFDAEDYQAAFVSYEKIIFLKLIINKI